MIEESRIHAGEDRKRKEEIQVGIRAENMIQAFVVLLERGKGILDQDDENEIEKKILAVKDSLSRGAFDEAGDKIIELNELLEVLSGMIDRKKRG